MSRRGKVITVVRGLLWIELAATVAAFGVLQNTASLALALGTAFWLVLLYL